MKASLVAVAIGFGAGLEVYAAVPSAAPVIAIADACNEYTVESDKQAVAVVDAMVGRHGSYQCMVRGTSVDFVVRKLDYTEHKPMGATVRIAFSSP